MFLKHIYKQIETENQIEKRPRKLWKIVPISGCLISLVLIWIIWDFTGNMNQVYQPHLIIEKEVYQVHNSSYREEVHQMPSLVQEEEVDQVPGTSLVHEDVVDQVPGTSLVHEEVVNQVPSTSLVHEEVVDQVPSTSLVHEEVVDQVPSTTSLIYEKEKKPVPAFNHYYSARVAPGVNKIIFVETSCVFNTTSIEPSGVKLNARQACSVYSAAVVNSKYRVLLFLTCPLHEDYYEMSSEYIKHLLDLPNVGVVDVGNDPGSWFFDSPLEGFEKSLSQSSYKVEHASDALRILLLWKYGGVYLDLDVVSIKSLESLGENWAVVQDGDCVANGILGMTFNHPVAGDFLNKTQSSYNPSAWTAIGPALFTSVLVDKCKLKKPVAPQDLPDCNFKVHPTNTFLAIAYPSWQMFFDPNAWQKVYETIVDSVGVHVWNKLSKGETPKEGSAYARLASTHCSLIFQDTREHF